MMLNDPKVGDYVYKHCHPLNPGVIVSVDGKDFGGYFMCVHVEWLKPTRIRSGDGLSITAETTAGLKDFNWLIADHRKKLATHETSLMGLHSIRHKIQLR